MGYSGSVHKNAADRLAQRRLAAEKQADARRRQIYEKLPRARELEQAIAACGSAAVRAVLRGGDVVEEMTQLKEKNLSLQAELRDLLLQNGYAANALEPQYSCEKCSDTGYVEQGSRTVMCGCLKQQLVACACEEFNRIVPLQLSTFETFDVERYSKTVDPATGVVPYNQMEKIIRFCKAYARGFTPQSQSILMKGATGLGKTHLSLAIANEVIRRGYGVMYVSAPELVIRLERERFSREREGADTLETLTACDLLIIDDLGTEHHSSYTDSQVYTLFNARLLSGKPVIISTNLTMMQLQQDYSERFVSRINGAAQKLDFLGTDYRVQKPDRR